MILSSLSLSVLCFVCFFVLSFEIKSHPAQVGLDPMKDGTPDPSAPTSQMLRAEVGATSIPRHQIAKLLFEIPRGPKLHL